MGGFRWRWSGALKRGLSCAVALTCAWLTAAAAQEPQVGVKFIDAPLEPLVQIVADLTGKRFIVDPRVRAVVTLEMKMEDTPQGGEQLLQTLQTLLRSQGFTTQQVGNDIKIVPERVTAADPNDEPGRVISAAPRVRATQSNRNQLLSRPPSPAAPDWSKEINFQPVFSNGVQRGYRVYPGGTGAELARLGLDTGDLVSSINGRVLNDPSHGMQVFYAALAAPTILVRIERAGRDEYLQLANHYARIGPSATAPTQPRQPQAEDPSLAAVLLQPVYENGMFRGFRVYPGKPGGIFGPQGLIAGDLVLAANGEALASSGDADKLGRLLESPNSVLLKLQRAGELLEVAVIPQPVAVDESKRP